mgnify:CR=1 FL=1
MTSALGAPGGKCNGWLKYGEGYLDSAEIGELACDLSLIEKSAKGGYYTLTKYDKKVQGFDSLCQLIEKDITIYNELLEEIRGLLR